MAKHYTSYCGQDALKFFSPWYRCDYYCCILHPLTQVRPRRSRLVDHYLARRTSDLLRLGVHPSSQTPFMKPMFTHIQPQSKLLESSWSELRQTRHLSSPSPSFLSSTREWSRVLIRGSKGAISTSAICLILPPVLSYAMSKAAGNKYPKFSPRPHRAQAVNQRNNSLIIASYDPW
jgi:hypothetical protein